VIAPNYQWYYNNSVIPGAIERAYEISNQGLYHVAVSDDNCLFLSDGTSVTSIEDKFNEGNINIFPNPTSGQLTIEMNNKITGLVEIGVYDLLGNKIMDLSFDKNSEVFQRQFSLQSFTGGIYNIVTRMDGIRFVKKLVITE